MIQLRNASNGRLFGYYSFVVAAHLLGWGAVLWLSTRYTAIVGLGALAYVFGIRHAFDADHISAIDNVTRKLLRAGKDPLGTGFFFSLGHSSVVFLVAVGIGLAAQHAITGVVARLPILARLGGFLGTGISGLCLLAIGLLNSLILVDVYRAYRRRRSNDRENGASTRAGLHDGGQAQHDSSGSIESTGAGGGLMFRLFGRLFRFVRSGRQMFFVGVLFGLGFDTASEVALLGVSAGAAARGMSILAVLALPVLFAAGMVLMDTSDGALMAKAYGWSAGDPVRRSRYNLAMTGLSVVSALAIGSVELVRVAIGLAGGTGTLRSSLGHIDSWTVGLACIALFAIIWIGVNLLAKRRRLSPLDGE